MTRHVIIGKGAVGTTLAHHLADEGTDVLVLSRSGGTSAGRITHAAVDATDADALTAATQGAEVVYSCAAPPYHRWPTDWPPLWAAMLDAAARTGAVLVSVGNLYGYATHGAVMTEQTPLDSTERKGMVRAQMWRDAEARHRAGDLRVTEIRAADYFGPFADAQAMLGPRFLTAAARRQGGADGHRRRPAAQLDLPARPRPHARRRRPDARRLGARLARPHRGAADRARRGRPVRRRWAQSRGSAPCRPRSCVRWASCRRCCARSRPCPTTSPSPTSWTPPRRRGRSASSRRPGTPPWPRRSAGRVSEGARSVGQHEVRSHRVVRISSPEHRDGGRGRGGRLGRVHGLGRHQRRPDGHVRPVDGARRRRRARPAGSPSAPWSSRCRGASRGRSPRQALTVDHLSGGRLVLPVGLGAVDDGAYSRVSGETTDVKERAALLDDSLAILDLAWTGEKFSYAGTHHQVTDLEFRPRPVRGTIPVWVIGAWFAPRSMRRAVSRDGKAVQIGMCSRCLRNSRADARQAASLAHGGCHDGDYRGGDPGPGCGQRSPSETPQVTVGH